MILKKYKKATRLDISTYLFNYTYFHALLYNLSHLTMLF